ncbi:SubName: Full=Uncharacterized protein {ECO:0000313/EMBL:CCA71045.1} [Serendipita indica DSM 11827]|nr:SubName: Full=Uncharacterized protein {ECO:0000313/EMBL:CCA71045.1} [Serendipita indica DSM 11827]
MSGLCVACCSTLRKGTQGSYTTTCCNKIICESCLKANPRLKEYSPCLACGGGVQVVGSSSRNTGSYKSPRIEQFEREANTFVVGGDSDDDDQESPEHRLDGPSTVTDVEMHSKEEEKEESPPQTNQSEQGGPRKYWLQKQDTLQGIALKYKLNSREICTLNGLPPSTLSTTPHLLHTRPFILLPQTDKQIPPPPPDAEARGESKAGACGETIPVRNQRNRLGHRQGLRCHFGGERYGPRYAMKRKEMGQPVAGTSSTGKASGAVDLYMDDEEWEREQLKAGLKPRIRPIPFFKG